MSFDPEIRAAAVVFRHGEDEREALADFARELAGAGCRVGGMVQEAFYDEQGRRTRIDSVDLASGERITINSSGGTPGADCTLDTAALTDAGAPLRRALVDRPDLVVAEKFGEQEQGGAGLMDEILAVIAEGMPVLVLVPEPALPQWRELTGGEIEEVACETTALRRWWHELPAA